jgi:hypothetical protein
MKQSPTLQADSLSNGQEIQENRKVQSHVYNSSSPVRILC